MDNHVKKMIPLFLSFCLLLGTLPGSTQAAEDERDLAWYRQNGVTVVNPTESSPMSFIGHDNEPKGYIIDLWRKWSNKTGIPVTFRMEIWTETLKLMKNGECDIHGGLFIAEERDTYLDFSEPYFKVESSLLILKEFDTEQEYIYANYTIGVLSEGYAEIFLKENHPETKLKAYPTIAEVTKGLAEGEIQGLAGDHPIMGYEAGKRGLAKKLVVKEMLYEKEMRGAVAEGNTVLLDIINQGLSEIDTSEREMLKERWFIPEVSPMNWAWDGLMIISILIIALVALMIFDRRKIASLKQSGDED